MPSPFLSAPWFLPTPHCDRARASDRQLGWKLPPEDERLMAWEEAEGDIKPDQRLLAWRLQWNANEDPHPSGPTGKGSARP